MLVIASGRSASPYDRGPVAESRGPHAALTGHIIGRARLDGTYEIR